MKIKLSKTQWEQIGTKQGWLKTAQVDTQDTSFSAEDPVLDKLRSPESAWSKLRYASPDTLKSMAVNEFTTSGILQDILKHRNCTPEIADLVKKNPNYEG